MTYRPGPCPPCDCLLSPQAQTSDRIFPGGADPLQCDSKHQLRGRDAVRLQPQQRGRQRRQARGTNPDHAAAFCCDVADGVRRRSWDLRTQALSVMLMQNAHRTQIVCLKIDESTSVTCVTSVRSRSMAYPASLLTMADAFRSSLFSATMQRPPSSMTLSRRPHRRLNADPSLLVRPTMCSPLALIRCDPCLSSSAEPLPHRQHIAVEMGGTAEKSKADFAGPRRAR